MLYDVLLYLNVLPYGEDERGLVQKVESGSFTISNGSITLTTEVHEGQYIVIEGSALNDGAYMWPTMTLEDEEFSGKVYVIRKNKAFFAVISEITEWQHKYADKSASPFQSESFGGYSYSKSETGGSWQTLFARSLSRWRKI